MVLKSASSDAPILRGEAENEPSLHYLTPYEYWIAEGKMCCVHYYSTAFELKDFNNMNGSVNTGLLHLGMSTEALCETGKKTTILVSTIVLLLLLFMQP